MASRHKHLPRITYVLLVVFLAVLLTRGLGDTTRLLIASSLLMFACCWSSAIHLLGGRAALHFVLISVVLGWFSEQMGSSHGWFFGHYTYTDVLGPTLGDVPFVIPLMWFALTYIGYVIANLMVWQTPSDGLVPLGQTLVMSLLAAMIVTAYDLGADPYMVFVLKAWIMEKKDGGWFGETLQGFVGWMLVSFTIIVLFRLSLRKRASVAALPVARRHALVPLFIYGGNMVFQMVLGMPVETRTIAFFAMGLPLLAALCGFSRWKATT
ncbi:carotenoid biosynthesis protein [Stigmatella sp. ncwal1]|uniref:Carotenoid biosynthesis protein n=1 Tax=Stigmatella ashevillensis TaxID=2995309 RepID=A0ABT5DED1_9BACT|nr:carotenoid biosynthesis protein [Stigmatella ashevillena]MDC0711861.1 carotenoid biosynthesis protein [Stigmatella ashevillena]